MSVIRADKDMDTGDQEISFKISMPALKLLTERLFVTTAMRERADLGDAAATEMIEIAEFLRELATEDEG